jgi:molybdate transport system substrate-binding protein
MDRRRFIVTALATTVGVTGALSGCARKDAATGAAPSAGPSPSTPAVTGEGTVFAAASLMESFKHIGSDFEKANPGTSITFNFGSSSALATQIIEGNGIGDVYASADETNMTKVSTAGLIDGSPVTFARNKLHIVVGPGNPRKIAGLADLAKPGLKLVLAAATVPVGRYGAEALSKAGVTAKPVSLEADVKAVLQKVVLGEADAGIVYTTDVKTAGDKALGVDIPDGQNVIASYPIAVVRNSKNPALAKAFETYVLSDAGRKVLVDNGFIAP